MHTNSRVYIGRGRSHPGCRSRSGRQSAYIDTLRINRIAFHDLARDTRDEQRFTSIPLLVAGAKPVPTLRQIGVTWLSGVDHETGLLLSNQIHARPGSKIVRRLSTSVQHHDEGKRLAVIATGDVDFVGAAACRVGIDRFNKPSALGHNVRNCHRRALYPSPESGRFYAIRQIIACIEAAEMSEGTGEGRHV